MRKMKNSGIEWIGEIPEDWEIIKVRGFTKIIRGNSSFTKNELLTKGEYVALQYGKTYKTHEIDKDFNFYVNDEFYKESQVVNFGDIILVSTSETLEDLGHTAFYNRTDIGLIGGEQILLKLFSSINPKFIFYSSKVFTKELQKHATGLKVFRFKIDHLKRISIPLPPLPEQQAIADYLDQKCSEIDEAIESAEKSIEEYNDYKQSLIFEVTTKGLDPNVKMKDSGIEWIGEIPTSWKVGRLKSMLSISKVNNRPNATVLSLYRDYGIIPKDSRDDNYNVTSTDTTKYKFVEVGDFVINKMKAWQGSMALSAYEGIVSPAYHVLKFVSSRIEPRYAHMLLRTKPYAQEWDRLSTGLRVGQWDLHVDDFLNTPIPLPPLPEQQAIANYLDQKCSAINETIEAKKRIIEELKAYKQSLIFETVTGKKEIKPCQ